MGYGSDAHARWSTAPSRRWSRPSPRRRADAHGARAQRAAPAARQAVPATTGPTSATARSPRASKTLRTRPSRCTLPIDPIRRKPRRRRPCSTTSRRTTSTTSTSCCSRARNAATSSTSSSERAGPQAGEDSSTSARRTARMARLRDVTYELEWGKSLIDFKPEADHREPGEVGRGRGWDRPEQQGDPRKVTVHDPDDQDQPRPARAASLGRTCEPREEVVVNEPHVHPEQAQQRALAILSDAQGDGRGERHDRRPARPARRAARAHRGPRRALLGTYFVTETTHTIDDSGYTTQVHARREAAGGGRQP